MEMKVKGVTIESGVRIEKGVKIEKKELPSRGRWAAEFDKMEPGDSFHFQGGYAAVIAAFGSWMAKGNYALRKEGTGYRFFLLKGKPK